MTTEFRTVIDTGVSVSAVLLPRSIPRRAFDAAFAFGTVLISESSIQELEEVLRRSKFERYVPKEKRLEFLASLVYESETIEVSEIINECRDPKDNKFLELAISGKATHVLSSDADLLVLNPFRSIEILAPSEYLNALPQ